MGWVLCIILIYARCARSRLAKNFCVASNSSLVRSLPIGQVEKTAEGSPAKRRRHRSSVPNDERR